MPLLFLPPVHVLQETTDLEQISADKITDSVIDRRKPVRFSDARFSAFNGALFRDSTVLSHGAQPNAANAAGQRRRKQT